MKISADLMKLQGSRVVNIKTVNGKNEYYLAVPLDKLFIPKDAKNAFLMLTAIPTPNSPYGDFLIKEFIKAEDYNLLSQEEKQAIPILGKANFLRGDNNKVGAQLAYASGSADVEQAGVEDYAAQRGQGLDYGLDDELSNDEKELF